jgi:hypothetical protein
MDLRSTDGRSAIGNLDLQYVMRPEIALTRPIKDQIAVYRTKSGLAARGCQTRAARQCEAKARLWSQ